MFLDGFGFLVENLQVKFGDYQ